MERYPTAYFVYEPRTSTDLLQPHDIRLERPFQIAATVTLSAMDYENFITDLLADRAFLEEHAGDCSEGEVWQCILVRQRNQKDGILVVPDGCYVKYAAAAKHA